MISQNKPYTVPWGTGKQYKQSLRTEQLRMTVSNDLKSDLRMNQESPVFRHGECQETFGSNTRLELLSSCFAIGKLIIQLQKFNDQNKEEARIKVYMDIERALVLCHDILSGRLAQCAKTMESKNGGLAKVFTSPGGSSREGEITYREFSISKGKKFIISALEMPGKKTETGGYVPDKEKAAEKRSINIGVEPETLKAIAILIQNEYQAYRTAQYVKLANYPS